MCIFVMERIDIDQYLETKESQFSIMKAPRTKATDYQKYLATKEWKERSKQIREIKGNFCQFCGATADEATLSVHHTPQAYRYLGEELDHIELMTVLCQSCHRHGHKNKTIMYRFKKIK